MYEDQEESGKNFQRSIHSIYGAEDPEEEKKAEDEEEEEDKKNEQDK